MKNCIPLLALGAFVTLASCGRVETVTAALAVSLAKTDSNLAAITWAADSTATRYAVGYTTNGSSTVDRILPSSALAATFTGLNKATGYSFFVRGISSTGETSSEGFVDTTTLNVFTPYEVSSLSAWFRADLNVTFSSGTLVSSWVDATERVTASRANTTGQPNWVASEPTLSNQPTITFDGVSQALTLNPDPSVGLSAYTIVAVAKSNAATSTSFISFRGATIPLMQLDWSAGFPRFIARDTNNVTGTATSAVVYAGYKILRATRNGNFVSLHVNGNLDASATPTFTGNFIVRDVRLGGTITASTVYAPVEIAELLFFSADITGATATAVESYLQTKYGL